MNIFNQYELANHYYDLTDYIDKNIYKFKRNGRYLQENWLVGVGIVAGIGLLAWLVTWLIKKNKNKKDNKKNIADIKQKQDKLKQAKEKEKEKYEKASEEEKENMEADALVQEVVINSPETILNSGGGSSSSSGGSPSQAQQQNIQGSSAETSSTPQSANVPTGENPSSSSSNTPSINNPTLTQPKTPPENSKTQSSNDTKTKVAEILNNLSSSKEESTGIGTTLGALLSAPKDHREKVIQKAIEKIDNPTSELKNTAVKVKKVTEQKAQIEKNNKNIENTEEQLKKNSEIFLQKLNNIKDKSLELLKVNIDNNSANEKSDSLYKEIISPNINIEDEKLIEKLDKLNDQIETFSNKFNKIYYVFLQFTSKSFEIYEKNFQNNNAIDFISQLFISIEVNLSNLINYYNHCINNNFSDQDIISSFNITNIHTYFQEQLSKLGESIQFSNDIFGFFFGSGSSENIDNTKISDIIKSLQDKLEELKKNPNIQNNQNLQILNDKDIKMLIDGIVKCQFSLESIKTNISKQIEIINLELNTRLELITKVNKEIKEVQENNKHVKELAEICTDFLITFLLACYIQEYNGRISNTYHLKNKNLIKLDGTNGNLNLPNFPILNYDEYSKLFSFDYHNRQTEWEKILRPVFVSYELNEDSVFSKSDPDNIKNTLEDSWDHNNYNIQDILNNHKITNFVHNINSIFETDFKSERMKKEAINLNDIIFHFFKTININYLKTYKFTLSNIQYIDNDRFKIAKNGIYINRDALKTLLPEFQNNDASLDTFNNYIKNELKTNQSLYSNIPQIVSTINNIARQDKIEQQEIKNRNIDSIYYVQDQYKLNETEEKNKEYLDNKNTKNNN